MAATKSFDPQNRVVLSKKPAIIITAREEMCGREGGWGVGEIMHESSELLRNIRTYYECSHAHVNQENSGKDQSASGNELYILTYYVNAGIIQISCV